MKTVPVDTAQTTLLDLIAHVRTGEHIVLTQDDKPVAMIVGVPPPVEGKRQFGQFRGTLKVGPEFFDPLPEDEMEGLG